jgi:hypothetical protein
MFICRCCGNDGICAFNKGRARVVARNILAAFQLLTCQREARETRVPATGIGRGSGSLAKPSTLSTPLHDSASANPLRFQERSASRPRTQGSVPAKSGKCHYWDFKCVRDQLACRSLRPRRRSQSSLQNLSTFLPGILRSVKPFKLKTCEISDVA